MIEINIRVWKSFIEMRKYIREMKSLKFMIRLVDRRSFHVFLITVDGKRVVYKSTTFNKDMACLWAEQKYPGCEFVRLRREGERGYIEPLMNEW